MLVVKFCKLLEMHGGHIQMKILMLTWEYPPRVVGGISKVVYDLSHKMVKEGN